MPYNTKFGQIFKSILKKRSTLSELAEYEEISNEILSMIQGENGTKNSQSLLSFLAQECGIRYIDIMFLFKELIINSASLEINSEQITKQWLIIKICQIADILQTRSQAIAKRKCVQEVFRNYKFEGCKIESLIQASFKSIQEPFQTEDIAEIAAQFNSEMSKQIKKLFANKPAKSIVIKNQTNTNKINNNEEQLNDLISDFKKFPEESFERILQGELIWAYARKFSVQDKIDKDISFESQLGQLRDKYIEHYGQVTKEIQALLAKINSKQPQIIYDCLCALKSSIFSIDVFELQRLIAKTKNSEKFITGKDLIMLIGTTGSGKSTNILKFLGYTLTQDICDGLKTLVPVQQLEKEHKSFRSSPLPISCSRYINAVAVPDKMYPFGIQKSQKTLMLCDTPGFGDTSGLQVDIANGVGMINAIYGAKSVRVVVIISYHCLVADRMTGVIKIGEIISNLIRQTSAFKSIKIYFNKVPPSQIERVPLQINKKIQYLTQTQRSNQKIIDILELMLFSSRNKDNFLNPIQGDYKGLIQGLLYMPPIRNLTDIFQYEFTVYTKKEIEKFIQVERNKVKDYLMEQKYKNARFHLKLLEILKNILKTNEKLKIIFRKLIQHIQKKSVTKFIQYEEFINDLIHFQNSSAAKIKLNDCKNNLISIHHQFNQFQNISLISEEKINQLIDEKKKKLLQKLDDISNLNDQVIKTIQNFSKNISSNLERQFAQIIDNKFTLHFQEIQRLIKEKKYKQINGKIQKLTILYKYLMRSTQFIQSLSAKSKMQIIHKFLEDEVQQSIKIIELVMSQPLNINEKIVDQVNIRIANIQNINRLNFLENNQEIQQRLNLIIKNMQVIFKKMVKELNNFKMALDEDDLPNEDSQENQLSTKKKVIEFLMKINCIGENLKEDYDCAIENISKNLKENVEILKNGIAALKGNKTYEIFQNLQNIKKATVIVLRCSNIVDKKGESHQLALSIEREFLTFLNGQIQILQVFQVRLNRVPQQSYFERIMEQCRKIETYAKMGIIGINIKQAVEKIRQQFKVKLNTPLKEFLQKQITNIEQKKSYKFLTYSLDKLQKLCTYLFQAEDNFSIQYRSQIKESQIVIADRLQPFFQVMQEDIAKFLILQDVINEHPSFLKDLVKILLTLNTKKKTCLFLNLRVEFNIEDNINFIQRKLKEIFDILENNFNGHAKAAQIQSIYQNCKFYSEIEDYYKQSKFGFKELQKKCSIAYTKSLQHDEDRIRVLIKDTSPTKISFSNLKTFYQQFRALNGPQGARKRRYIVDELRIVQKNCQVALNKFKKDMDDPDFLNKDDFLKAFQEANVLVKELNELYTEEEDKKSITIQKDDIRKIGIKIISVFQNKFEIVYNQIMEQNIDNIQENIKNFGSLEAMIYEVFPLEALIEENVQGFSKVVVNEYGKEVTMLINFVLKQVNLLKSIIETHPHLKQEKQQSKQTIKLKILLEYFRKGTQIDIHMKYKTVSTMQFNAGFQRYYSRCNLEQKLQLNGKINQKMDMLFQQYKEKMLERGDAAQSFFIDIETYFNYLPFEISSYRRIQIKKLKAQLINRINKDIQDASRIFSDNPEKSKVFFNQSRLSIIKKQSEIHQKYVKAIETFFDQSNYPVLTLQKKFEFLNLYFIKILQNNDTYFKEDLVMLQSLSKWFSKYVKSLVQEGKENLKIIKGFMQNPETKQKKTFFKQLIANIFKIYRFILSIKDDLCNTLVITNKSSGVSNILNTKLFKEHFAEEYQHQILEIGRRFSNSIANRKAERISITDLLDHIKMKKVQTEIQYLKIGGFIINNIQAQITIFQKSQTNWLELKKFEKADYSKILEEYSIQLKMMYKFCDEYQFYTEQKRNWPPKVIEEDIKTLDHNFRILTERKQFFIKNVVTQEHKDYDFDGIKSKILKRFDQLVEYSKKEIKKTFQSYYGDPATKVNLLVAQLQAMEKKQLMIIKPELVKNILKELKELVRSESVQICTKASHQFKELQENIQDLDINIRRLRSQKDYCIYCEDQTFDTQLSTKRKEIEQYYNAQIKLQISVDKKAQLRNTMKAQTDSIKKELNDIKAKNIADIERKYSEQFQSCNKSLSPKINAFTQSVKIIKKSSLDLCVQAEKRDQMTQKLLEGVNKLQTKYYRMIQQQFDEDEKDQWSIGKQILNSSKSFRHYQARKFNELIKCQDITYFIQKLEKISINGRQKVIKDELDSVQSCYELFKIKNDQLKKRYQYNPTNDTIDYIVQQVKTLANQLKNEFYFSRNQNKYAVIHMNLLAGIFALWAIQRSQVFSGEVEFTNEPHPTHITAIILLLGIYHSKKQLENCLTQFEIGQGKSIVMAGLSCYLALVGFKVRCAYISAYLSGRDYESFKSLFELLSLQNQIRYGVFHQLCEQIIHLNGNIVQKVKNMIFPQKQELKIYANNQDEEKFQSLHIHKPVILLIDDIDVLFDRNLFCKNYCPSITLKDPTIKLMLQLVWREVSQKQKDIDIDRLLDSQEFKNLTDRYPSIRELLENQVHGMIAGALNYKHDYVIIDKRISYKDTNFDSLKINFGYKTIFANMFEYQEGRISRQSLDESMQICLNIAEFSYSNFPSYFKNIIGVSDTLQLLPKYKKQLLVKLYKITNQFTIPSAFGIKKRLIEDYTITSRETFCRTIINKINQVKYNRPIIIFFKNPREIYEFYEHPMFEPYQARANNLTEEHDPFTRNSRVAKAVEPNSITLITNSFGRGTDFVLLDDKIKENGGLHVIQAFLSLDESQEVQIKGRTARQSGKGSYNCILSDNWLEELELKPEDIPKNATSDTIHNILLQARQAKIAKQASSTLKALKVSDEMHEKTINIFTKPKLAQTDLINYVYDLNKYPEIRNNVIRTVLGLDATGSMSTALRKTCEIIGNAFTETYAVLRQKKVKATIEIKIVVYRNYNSSKEQILQSTSFENTPNKLKAFLQRVSPKGGWGNEALQVLFQFLNKDKKIDQVILVGDAAPNTRCEIDIKRKTNGEEYWIKNGFPATHIDKEIEEFARKKCPVHSFYLNNGAGFKQISAKTQGQAAPFNINSSTATKDLRSFVVINILKIVQKNNANKDSDLVNTYKKMFL